MFTFLKENEMPLDTLLDTAGYVPIFRTIACIGDSLSSGEFESDAGEGKSNYHDMFEYSWGQYMARMCGNTVYNMSRGGMTAREFCDGWADQNGFWNAKYASQAYIIALGVNDVNWLQNNIIDKNVDGITWDTDPLGTIDDIHDDWHDNPRNFVGHYATIVQRMKEIQPRAKFFFVTMPRWGEEPTRGQAEHAKVLHQMAEKFDNSYVIDLNKYAIPYDDSTKEALWLRGHMSPMGYIYTARLMISYIDYLIRKYPADFKEVPYIGTELHA